MVGYIVTMCPNCKMGYCGYASVCKSTCMPFQNGALLGLRRLQGILDKDI